MVESGNQVTRIYRMAICLITIGFFLVSCQKEGQYSPKGKIQRVYYSWDSSTSWYDAVSDQWVTYRDSTGKKLQQVWYWEGKLLQQIDHFQGNEHAFSQYFFYDKKNRLSKITEEGCEMVLTYSGNVLDHINVFEHDRLGMTIDFIREGDRVVEMDVFEYISQMPQFVSRMLEPVMPVRLMESMEVGQRAAGTRGTAFTKVELEWEKNNVARVTFSGTENQTPQVIEYKYDNKKNPYHGLWDVFLAENGEGMRLVWSENNIVKMTSYAASSPEQCEVKEFQYEYVGKCPVSRREDVLYNNESGTYKYSSQSVYYYEY